MADKSFGVKELNLLNASGTPTITSPNNLNLNANNVAISTNLTIGGNLTVSNNIGISSLNVTGIATVNNFKVAGVSTFADDVKFNGSSASIYANWDQSGNALFFRDNSHVKFGDNNGMELTHAGGAGGNGNINNRQGGLVIRTIGTDAGDIFIDSKDDIQIRTHDTSNSILCTGGAGVKLYFAGGEKLETTTNGIDVTGAITVNGSATSAWTISNNSSSNYVISGPGGLSSANNPDLYLERGQTYQFIMNAAGHGFGIQTSSGTWNNSNAYTTGITNAGAATGVITFQVPYSAPDRLYYACTSQHSGMVGNIYIQGAGRGRGILTQNTTLTGSSMTFDNIPTWATKITVNLLEASLSGSDQIYVRLRAGSSSITSDYSCVSGNFQGNIISGKTDAFNIYTTGGAQLLSGSMVIEKIDSAGLKYVQSHMFLITNNNSRHGGGNLERSSGAAVDGVEIRAESSNTFDNGVVTIYYE